MSAHTPGPWHVSGMVRAAVVIGDDVIRLDLGGTAKANARLIAASPELLDVVLAYLHHFERHHITNTHGARDFDFTGQIADMARAAIAKATGDSE